MDTGLLPLPQCGGWEEQLSGGGSGGLPPRLGGTQGAGVGIIKKETSLSNYRRNKFKWFCHGCILRSKFFCYIQVSVKDTGKVGGGEEEVTCLSPAKARPPLLVAVDAHSAEALGGQASHLRSEEVC